MQDSIIEALRSLIKQSPVTGYIINYCAARERCKPNMDIARLTRELRVKHSKADREGVLKALAGLQSLNLGILEQDARKQPRFAWRVNYIDLARLVLSGSKPPKGVQDAPREMLAELPKTVIIHKGDVTIEVTTDQVRAVVNALRA